jgi:chlorophyll/bacteriochlorophyll a synthase
MRRYAALYARMLRYRVASMVWMFMLLAAARADGLTRFSWAYVWATVALASSYVTATAVNDIADEQIDLVNHPREHGRPLVSGDATPRDLYRLHAVAALLALASAAAIGLSAVAVIAGSLAIAWTYSLPPVRFSYRTYLAPLVLGIAYVGVPYELGILAAGGRFDPTFAAGLFALFVARINLKDFRDRAGDARFGRPTLLLRYGKDVTCLVSLLALLAGNALLLAALEPPFGVAALLELYVLAVAWMLFTLREAPEGRLEQVAIGLGARMGNGLLIAVLASLILAGRGAVLGHQLVLELALLGAFGLSFVTLARRPDQVVLGYKG